MSSSGDPSGELEQGLWGLGLWRSGLSSGQAGVGRRGECLPTNRLTYCKKKKVVGTDSRWR